MRTTGAPTAVRIAALALCLCAGASPALAAEAAGGSPSVAGIPVDFILFGATLLGVALFHAHVFHVALGGLAVITAYKLAITGFKQGPGLAGLMGHLGHKWVTLANLFCLLMGHGIGRVRQDWRDGFATSF